MASSERKTPYQCININELKLPQTAQKYMHACAPHKIERGTRDTPLLDGATTPYRIRAENSSAMIEKTPFSILVQLGLADSESGDEIPHRLSAAAYRSGLERIMEEATAVLEIIDHDPATAKRNWNVTNRSDLKINYRDKLVKIITEATDHLEFGPDTECFRNNGTYAYHAANIVLVLGEALTRINSQKIDVRMYE